jgi:hypothetical protein
MTTPLTLTDPRVLLAAAERVSDSPTGDICTPGGQVTFTEMLDRWDSTCTLGDAERGQAEDAAAGAVDRADRWLAEQRQSRAA